MFDIGVIVGLAFIGLVLIVLAISEDGTRKEEAESIAKLVDVIIEKAKES